MLCVLAVLIGLFGMHGLASDAAGGCHQLPGATSPAAHSAMPTMTDASCVFVAPTSWPPLALVVLAIVVATALSVAGARRAPALGGRSPPDSLLQRVCVSRT